MDIDTIKGGRDWVEAMEQAVQECDVLIAVIGKTWLTIKDQKGTRRLDDPQDKVRFEIEAALQRNIPVIPVLVGGGVMPKASELPDTLGNLARRQAMLMSHERFRAEVAQLIEQIKELTDVASKEKLTPPEGMVLIPKGSFLYGEEKEEVNIPDDYYMDVHPVWNAAYAKFIEAGGYSNPSYWTEEGWAWMVKSKITGWFGKLKFEITQPGFWKDSKWNQPFQPVVGVSFYEAEAYAKWAGKRLPTEEKWEKAARGTDGRIYPWGDEFDSGKCNSKESGIEKTAPIGTYPQGKSPFGCQDMAGNVWEWCASCHAQSDGGRVVRGGSWFDIPEFLRSSFRFWDSTVFRCSDIGFRLAQDIP